MTKSQTEKADEVRAEAEGREIPEARGRAREDNGAPQPPRTEPPKISIKRRMELLKACQLRIRAFREKEERIKQDLASTVGARKSSEAQRDELLNDTYTPELFDNDDDTETE